MSVSQMEFLGLFYSENHYSAEVAASGTYDCTITPKSGQIYQLASIYLKADAPTGAASGTHKITIIPNQVGFGHFIGTSLFGSAIECKNYGFSLANSSEVPADSIDQMLLLQNLWCSNSNTLVIRYNNDTDVATTAVTDEQKFDLLFKVYKGVIDE